MAALLRTKRLVWAAALLFAVLALAVSYVSGRRYVEALEWVEHSHTVTSTLERLLSRERGQEAELRDFLITGDRASLAAAAASRRAVEHDLADLARLVAASPSERANAAAIGAAVADQAEFVRAILEESASGNVSQAHALVSSPRGRALMDRINDAVVRMNVDEARVLADRRAKAAATERQTLWAIGGLAAVMLALLAGSFLAMQRDARELREVASDLAESEERYRALVENVSDLVALHGPDGNLLYVSPSVETLLGYAPREVQGGLPFPLMHPDDSSAVSSRLRKLTRGPRRTGMLTFRLRRQDGEYRWFEFTVTRVDHAEGTVRHFQSAGRDVTVRRQLEQRLAVQAEELRNLSLRDGLTGLYNRRGFLELSAQFERVAEREQHPMAVLFVDLDGLKDINDRHGHGHGDLAINEMADLLRSTCRATDLVARLGGDEFVVLASKVDDDALAILKSRLERALADVNGAPHRDYELAFSLGVAKFDPASPVPVEQLLSEADARMYEAKARRYRPRSTPASSPSTPRAEAV